VVRLPSFGPTRQAPRRARSESAGRTSRRGETTVSNELEAPTLTRLLRRPRRTKRSAAGPSAGVRVQPSASRRRRRPPRPGGPTASWSARTYVPAPGSSTWAAGVRSDHGRRSQASTDRLLFARPTLARRFVDCRSKPRRAEPAPMEPRSPACYRCPRCRSRSRRRRGSRSYPVV